MNHYSQFIYKSRYARWNDELKRREEWPETVQRYCDFWKERFGSVFPYDTVYKAIHDFEVMPSMRALMTAGEALSRDEIAGYNCSYLPIDHIRAFDEIMYILMCFHPGTKVKCQDGDKPICELTPEDRVLSFNETTRKFEWKQVLAAFKTPSNKADKYEITLENNTKVKCTWNHKWLTENRGWVMAKDLTLDDELVAPKFSIYKLTNTNNGKMYVGYTSKTPQTRFKQHCASAKTSKKDNHLFKAINKWGVSCWKIEVLDVAYTVEEAHNKERGYIQSLGTKEFGYNGTDGGEGATGAVRTPEQRKRMKASAYPRTEEHRRKQAQVMLELSLPKIKLRRQTQEYKEQIKSRTRNELGRFV